ncbi:hypothetical protein HY772_01095 [Candidatus Woesearchaeota archaeon]|nr:hypothetical protein [Candidatus Woesearchaeota archaeon]
MSFLGKFGRNWSAVAFVVVIFLAFSGALMLGFQKSLSGSVVGVSDASLPDHQKSSTFFEVVGVALLTFILSGILITVLSTVWTRVRGSSGSHAGGTRVALDELSKLNAQIEELNKSIRDVDRKL